MTRLRPSCYPNLCSDTTRKPLPSDSTFYQTLQVTRPFQQQNTIAVINQSVSPIFPLCSLHISCRLLQSARSHLLQSTFVNYCLFLFPESRQLTLYFRTIGHLHLHRQSSFTHCEPSHISRRNHYLPRHYHTTSVRSPSSSLSPYKWPPPSTAFPSNCSSRYSHTSTTSVSKDVHESTKLSIPSSSILISTKPSSAPPRSSV